MQAIDWNGFGPNAGAARSSASGRCRTGPSRWTSRSSARGAVGGAVTAPAGTFLGGIGLELRDGAGAVVETRTFEDGAWYVPRLAPGRYTLQVAASSLDALGAAAEPVALVVPADGDEELTAPVLAVRKRVLAAGGQ